ncbi:hypothetical protein ACFLQV_02145 [Calditrichota bacterium]
MMEKVRADFQRWCVSQALNRKIRRGNSEPISSHGCWENIQTCLVIWPGDGLDVTAGELILKRLHERFKDARLNVIALPGIGALTTTDIPYDKMQLNEQDFNFMGLPRKSAVIRLQDLRGDITIDLSPDFNPHSAYLSILSGAKLLIGFSDQIQQSPYNFQVAPNQSSQGIDRYKVLAQYIG